MWSERRLEHGGPISPSRLFKCRKWTLTCRIPTKFGGELDITLMRVCKLLLKRFISEKMEFKGKNIFLLPALMKFPGKFECAAGTVMTQCLNILALLWVRANPGPLRPINMGGPQEQKWPRIFSISKHSWVLILSQALQYLWHTQIQIPGTCLASL